MKRLAIVVSIGAVILGGIIFIKDEKVVYKQGETQIQEIEVETLQKRIEDATTASSTEIEREAQKAFEKRKAQMLTEIELQETRKYRAEIEAREEKLEEQVSL
jgi:glutamate synthase domain-containing protein 3